MKLFAISLIALFLGGCATDYAKYTEATSKAATAKALEKPALAEQLARLAGDDPTAKVAAIMAIAFMDKQPAPSEQISIEAPYSVGKFMRDLTGLAIPLANVGAQFYGIKQNAAVATAQSNNATAVALGDQRARVDSLNAVGSATSDIVSGLAAPLAEGIKKPTTVVTVNGNNNTTAGRDATSTVTTTNTNNCPQTTDARGGNGGNTSERGNTGQGERATSSQATECAAGK